MSEPPDVEALLATVRDAIREGFGSHAEAEAALNGIASEIKTLQAHNAELLAAVRWQRAKRMEAEAVDA